MATDILFTPFRPGTTHADGQRIAVIDQRLRRTNYFDGQLLKASDLTRDQIYLDERLLELGQALGTGIVRGLGITRAQPQVLRLAPGIAVAWRANNASASASCRVNAGVAISASTRENDTFASDCPPAT